MNNLALGTPSSSISKVVRRKKSGLVDDHFQAIIPSASCNDKKGTSYGSNPPPSQMGVHEDSPPPCNCPRHFLKPSQKHFSKTSSQEASSQTISKKSRNRLKTSDTDTLGKITDFFKTCPHTFNSFRKSLKFL